MVVWYLAVYQCQTTTVLAGAQHTGQLEIRMITRRGNKQSMDWILPESVIILGNLCSSCDEGMRGGVF